MNECLAGLRCQNGAVCIDTPGTYSCICSPGWTGRNCENDVIECDLDTCQNGGTCVEGAGPGFTCNCLQGMYIFHLELLTLKFDRATMSFLTINV